MLVQTSLSASTRLFEVRGYLHMLSNLLGPSMLGKGPLAGPIQAVSQEGPTLKGMFFIHLYGAYEFCVRKMVEESLHYINSQNLSVVDCKPNLLGFILDSQCHSLRNVGRNNIWPKRIEMFQMVNSRNLVQIDASILPTSGRNLDASELDSIWFAFGLIGSPLPSPAIVPRIQEVIQKRNEIAHGEFTPAQIGRRYTLLDLQLIFDDIELLCTHLILSFSSYLANGEYRA